MVNWALCTEKWNQRVPHFYNLPIVVLVNVSVLLEHISNTVGIGQCDITLLGRVQRS